MTWFNVITIAGIHVPFLRRWAYLELEDYAQVHYLAGPYKAHMLDSEKAAKNSTRRF